MYRNEHFYLRSWGLYVLLGFSKTICIVSIGCFIAPQIVSADQIKRTIIYNPIVIKKPRKTVKIIKPKIQRIEKTRVKRINTQPIKIIAPVGNVKKNRLKKMGPVIAKKSLTLKQRKAINRKVLVLNNKIKSERQNAQRIKLQKIKTLKLLRNTVKPVEKQRLRLEIIKIQQNLDLSKFKIKEFEETKVTYSIQLSASSQEFTDNTDHLGPSGPHKSNAPCFIATAAYGSSLASEVSVFRQFRDKYLVTNKMGRNFVEFYYDHSPPLAAFIAKYELSRVVTRIFLWPLLMLVKYPFYVLFMFCAFLLAFFNSGHHRSFIE